MKDIEIRGIMIGSGIPKICVPVTGSKKEEITLEMKAIAGSSCDLIEWRVDFFKNCKDLKRINEIMEYIRSFTEKPVIATFRSSFEGGMTEVSLNEYIEICKALCNSLYIDLIDIEFMTAGNRISEVLDYAKERNIKTIVSHHNFKKTPSEEEMGEILENMKNTGADIEKIAVMPSDRKDVLAVMNVSEKISEMEDSIPVISISMSNTGTPSRVCAELSGSAITFATVSNSSAPGQIDCESLRNILEMLYCGER